MLPSGTSANKRFLKHVSVGTPYANQVPLSQGKRFQGHRPSCRGLHFSNHVANQVIPLWVPEMPFQTCLDNVSSVLGVLGEREILL